MLYGCQQVLMKPSNELAAILEFICTEANKLTNCGIYLARQIFLKTGRINSKFDLHKEYKQNKHFQALYSQVAQQVLTTVGESFQSFKQLRKAHFEGKIEQRPRLPNYKKKGSLALVSYPKQALKLINGQIRIPLGSLVKTWFGIDSFTIPMQYHCLEHQIGNIVFGWNQSHKQNIDLGSRNNQVICQIPTSRLKERIKQLCQL